MSLSRSRIRELCTEGWACSDYNDELCDVDDHSGSHCLIDSKYELDLSGNAARLHVGETFRPSDEPTGPEGLPGWFNSYPGSYPREESEPAVKIPPGKFLFFVTEETFRFPFDVDGRLFMNPRVANRGLQFFTLGHIAPGFSGKLTGTLLNMTDDTIYLERSNPILYIVFSGTDAPSSHRTHENPQDTLQEARESVLTHPEPGFALTSEKFVTRQEYHRLIAAALAVISIMLIFTSIIVTNSMGVSG